MTTITKEQLIEWAEDCRMLAQCAIYARPADVAAAKNLALAEIALASLDAKPVGWTDAEELRNVEKDGCGYMFTVNPITAHADQRRVIKLYTAPPVAVVPEEVPATLRDEIIDLCDGYEIGDVGAQEIWSACRLVMIQGESLPTLA
ncbi:hypothetical protein ACERYM_000224 [Salmonella enterica]